MNRIKQEMRRERADSIEVKNILLKCCEAFRSGLTTKQRLTALKRPIYLWRYAIKKIIFQNLCRKIKERLVKPRRKNGLARKTSFCDEHIGLSSSTAPQMVVANRRNSMLRRSIDDSHVLENTNAQPAWKSITKHDHNTIEQFGSDSPAADKQSRRLSVISNTGRGESSVVQLPPMIASVSKSLKYGLQREFSKEVQVVSPPSVVESAAYPLSTPLTKQSSSRFDRKQSALEIAMQDIALHDKSQRENDVSKSKSRSKLAPLATPPTAFGNDNILSAEDIQSLSDSDSESSLDTAADNDDNDSDRDSNEYGNLRASLCNQLPQIHAFANTSNNVNSSHNVAAAVTTQQHSNHTHGLRLVPRVGSFRYTTTLGMVDTESHDIDRNGMQLDVSSTDRSMHALEKQSSYHKGLFSRDATRAVLSRENSTQKILLQCDNSIGVVGIQQKGIFSRDATRATLQINNAMNPLLLRQDSAKDGRRPSTLGPSSATLPVSISPPLTSRGGREDTSTMYTSSPSFAGSNIVTTHEATSSVILNDRNNISHQFNSIFPADNYSSPSMHTRKNINNNNNNSGDNRGSGSATSTETKSRARTTSNSTPDSSSGGNGRSRIVIPSRQTSGACNFLPII